MKVIEITDDSFAATVLDSPRPVLLDFSATWCGPCARMAPIVEALAAAHPEIAVCHINVDESPALAAAYDIESIPTVLALKDGRVVGKTVGVVSADALLALLN